MPELSDFMYCSEQICIPPTFPYLLRQYAKAAIRSQPADLLKWSTAYFRCLSLGVPPPVKPRLEYPIPRDYHGLTPGWIKALHYQLQNNQTVSFRILWDRWIGACMIHEVLIQILCLAGFKDNTAVPWLRFIAMCAAFLTDCLTQTMILICEILTEEPEGGSAMIPLEIFLDLYKFLAAIDASEGQWLANLYFTDSMLNLLKKKAEEEAKKAIEEEAVKEESEKSEEVVEEKVEEAKVKEEASVISCPSIQDDEYDIEKYLKEIETEGEEGGEAFPVSSEPELPKPVPDEDEEPMLRGEDQSDISMGSAHEISDEKIDTDLGKEGEMPGEGEEGVKPEAGSGEDLVAREPEEHEEEEKKVQMTVDETTGEDKTEKAIYVDTLVEVPITERRETGEPRASIRVSMLKEEGVDLVVQEDLERLKEMQKEIYGETDDEIEKLKKTIIGEIHRTRSDEETLRHYDTKIYMSDETPSEDEEERKRKQEEQGAELLAEEEEEEEKAHEMIYVDAVPGIGAVVPEDMVEAVCKYMRECAKEQHGVVMPRNIRHFNCPPLEHYPKCNEKV